MSKLLTKSERANENYLAKVIILDNLEKHPQADRLFLHKREGVTIITDNTSKLGDIKIYFPIECALSHQFLYENSEYSDASENKNKEKKGFFGKQKRVKPVRLRNVPSEGFMVPVETLSFLLTDKEIDEVKNSVGVEFDTVKEHLLLEKYVPKQANPKVGPSKLQKKAVKPVSRLIENQFRLHYDTSHLGRNIFKIEPNDWISISNKIHGSSWVVANILNKKPLNWRDKLAKWLLKANVVDTEYDTIYSSRKVIKNKDINPNAKHYYKTDLWGDISNDIKHLVRKGETFYGEVVGYTKDGSIIQKGYHYGNPVGKYKIYVYRITVTNPDGEVFDLSFSQVKERCKEIGLETVPEYYTGYAKDLFPELLLSNHWQENFLEKLQETYLEKTCPLNNHEVPDEGIILRKEGLLLESFKLKSFAFKMYESKQLDDGVLDLETQESNEDDSSLEEYLD